MKKREFKKMLKEEKHHIAKEGRYLGYISLIYFPMIIISIFLQMKNILADDIAFALNWFMIIIGAVPVMIFDIERDKKIKKMYEYYQKENKILEVNDSVKYLKVALIIQIIVTLIVGSYITSKYIIYPIKNNSTNESVLEISTKSGRKVKTEYYNFDSGRFSLKAPKNFQIMNQEMIKLKYPKDNLPSLVLTNDKATINVVANITNNPMEDYGIRTYIEANKKLLLASSNKVLNTNFYERDGHKIGEIKFISKAADTEIYNHFMAFSDNGFLRIVSFNCTKDLQKDWEKVGEFVLHSIKFNEKE